MIKLVEYLEGSMSRIANTDNEEYKTMEKVIDSYREILEYTINEEKIQYSSQSSFEMEIAVEEIEFMDGTTDEFTFNKNPDTSTNEDDLTDTEDSDDNQMIPIQNIL